MLLACLSRESAADAATVMCFIGMTVGKGNMAVMQVSSSQCESRRSSLIGAVQLSGSRGWMSNVSYWEPWGDVCSSTSPSCVAGVRTDTWNCPARAGGEVKLKWKRNCIAPVQPILFTSVTETVSRIVSTHSWEGNKSHRDMCLKIRADNPAGRLPRSTVTCSSLLLNKAIPVFITAWLFEAISWPWQHATDDNSFTPIITCVILNSQGVTECGCAALWPESL